VRVTKNWHCDFRCLSPLSHGGDESAGNTSLFRRLPLADGSEVPAISGNSLRGRLRRIAAKRLLELLGVEALTDQRIFHLLFSGGAIQKGEVASAHRVADIREMRELLPSVSLFGASWRTEILPGTLAVEWILPDCAEIHALRGQEGAPSPPARQLTTMVMYTRHDDSEAGGDDKVQMLYETEALVPGTTLTVGLGVRRATTLEVGALQDAWSEWWKHPRLGGMNSRGHGALMAMSDDPIGVEHVKEYHDHVQGREESIREFLSAVGSPGLV